MAYSKTTWATGDVITAAKLNNIEDGVAANDTAIAGLAPFAMEDTLGVDGDSNQTITLNKKAGDLFAAIAAGRLCKVTAEVSEGVTCDYLGAAEAVKQDASGTVTYGFTFRPTGVGSFAVTGLSANDTVVLTIES